MRHPSFEQISKMNKEVRDSDIISNIHFAILKSRLDLIKTSLDRITKSKPEENGDKPDYYEYYNYIDDLSRYCENRATSELVKFIINYKKDDVQFLQDFNAFYFCMKFNLYDEILVVHEAGAKINNKHMEKIFGIVYNNAYNETIDYFINNAITSDTIFKHTKFNEIEDILTNPEDDWEYKHFINIKLFAVIRDEFRLDFVKHCKNKDYDWKSLLNFMESYKG